MTQIVYLTSALCIWGGISVNKHDSTIMPPITAINDKPNIIFTTSVPFTLTFYYDFWYDLTQHQHCKGYMATFQLYWWRKTKHYFRNKQAQISDVP